MDELTFLLILAGIGVILLVAMFTYYKHHKKINDEIKDFNHHGPDIDDVLLNDGSNEKSAQLTDSNDLYNHDFPNSFSASRQDNFDVDDVFIKNDVAADNVKDTLLNTESSTATHASTPAPMNETADTRQLVDGVYINSKRVINHSAPLVESEANQTDEPPLKTFFSTPASSSVQTSIKTQTVSSAVTQSEAEISQHSADSQVSKSQPLIKKSSQKIRIVYDPVPEGVKELIVSHTILTKGEYFTGSRLFHALESAGLYYGEMDIYHYPGNDKTETFALFSIANVVEPGTFNPLEPDGLRTPGISMFMRLPTRKASNDAYDDFIRVAQKIAAELDGELCDETRSQLTQQAISYKKEQIRKLNFDIAKAEKLAGSTN